MASGNKNEPKALQKGEKINAKALHAIFGHFSPSREKTIDFNTLKSRILLCK